MFLFAFWGFKILDFKNCFKSVVLSCYNDLDYKLDTVLCLESKVQKNYFLTQFFF